MHMAKKATLAYILYSISLIMFDLPQHIEGMKWIHISKVGIIVSDSGLSAVHCQVIIWTKTGLLLIAPLGASVSEISVKVQ